MNAIELSYALAKQVPSIQHFGAVIETNYGRLALDPSDSIRVAALVQELLTRKLERIKKQAVTP